MSHNHSHDLQSVVMRIALLSNLNIFPQALFFDRQLLMDMMKIIYFIVFLFLATCLFCWILTSHWIFGPIVTLVSFLSGLLLISLVGLAIIEQEQE